MSWNTVEEFLAVLPEKAAENREKLEGADGLYVLRTETRAYCLRVQGGEAAVLDSCPGEPDVSVEATEQQLLDLLNGKLSPMKALLLGRVKVRGDKKRLLKLAALA